MAALMTFTNAQIEVRPNPDGSKELAIHDLDSGTRYVVHLSDEQARSTAASLNAKGIMVAPTGSLNALKH